MYELTVARSATTSASAELPIVAILTVLSSSNVSDASNQTLPLFTLMLPSLMLSLDCGYRYVVVVGHDEHDEFYDTEQVTVCFFNSGFIQCRLRLSRQNRNVFNILCVLLCSICRVVKKRFHGFIKK
jgi:hypothetical protein